MRPEPSLNVTPEGSLVDIPSIVKRENIGQVPEGETLGTSSETAYMEFPDTHAKTKHRSPPSEVSRPIQGTKETSQVEALEST